MRSARGDLTEGYQVLISPLRGSWLFGLREHGPLSDNAVSRDLAEGTSDNPCALLAHAVKTEGETGSPLSPRYCKSVIRLGCWPPSRLNPRRPHGSRRIGQ
jgi:hypothetical protein